MPRLGVIGSLVWDEIHGRDPAAPPVEEWGGIAYSLAALDAALEPEWQIVPLIKVGRDLAPEADRFIRTLVRIAPGSRFVEVPERNNRVVLRYESAVRRCERMSGGVPPWTWPELGPMVADLDALYVNFISGFEMQLETAMLLRRGFAGPIYADLHSLFLGVDPQGMRFIRPLPTVAGWFACFDGIQLNEDELTQLGPEPLAAAAAMAATGVSLLNVTLGPRGVQYLARAGFSWTDAARSRGTGDPVSRTATLSPPPVETVDPTGCGDVFGATCVARLLAGDPPEEALAGANRAASRNATFRGASGLARYLRGETVLT